MVKRAFEAAAAALVLAAGAIGVAQYVWSDYGVLFGSGWWVGLLVIVAVPATVAAVMWWFPGGAYPSWHDDDF